MNIIQKTNKVKTLRIYIIENQKRQPVRSINDISKTMT